MKYLLVLWLVLACVPATAAALDVDRALAEFVDPAIPDQRRDELITQLSQAPFADVAPKMLPLMKRYATPWEPGKPDKPWMGRFHSVRAKIWYASAEIWNRLMRAPESAGRRDTLRSMLVEAQNADDQKTLLEGLGQHWEARAQTPVAELMGRASAAAEVRVKAAEVLWKRADAVRYFEDTMRLLASLSGEERSHAVGRFIRPASGADRLSCAQWGRLIGYAFEVVEEDHRRAPGTASGLAGDLGFVLGIAGEFSPDRAPYDTPNGPAKAYFETIEANALAWYAEHRTRLPLTERATGGCQITQRAG